MEESLFKKTRKHNRSFLPLFNSVIYGH